MALSYFSKMNSRKPKSTISVDDIIEMITNPTEQVGEIIDLIRTEQDPEKQRKLKGTLPAVTFSGTFSERKDRNLLQHSGLYVYDVDHLTAGALRKARKDVSSINSLVMAFISPSGEGLKIVLAGPTCSSADQHFREWSVGRALVEAIGLGVDSTGSDVCRLCFLSHDEPIEGFGEADPFAAAPVPKSRDVEDEDDLFDGIGGDLVADRDFSMYTTRMVREMLWVVGSDIPYRDWRNIIWGVVSRFGSKPAIKDMLLDWSESLGGGRALSSDDDLSHFMTLCKNKKSGVTLATLIKMAQGNGWGDWRKQLRRNEDGAVIKDDANLAVLLEEHPDFKGRIWNDEITYVKQMNKRENVTSCGRSAQGGPVDDNLGFEVLCDIQSGVGYGFKGVKTVLTAMSAIANRNGRNLRKEWLERLEWDGVPRMHRLFIDGFFADDVAHNEAVASMFLCGAVARIIMPGSPIQVVPILQGIQGTGKSSGLAALCPERSWFCDSMIDMESKAGYEVILSSSIVELAELSSMKRTDLARVKQFVLQQTVKFREPYARAAIDRPSTWVFIGTTNDEECLKDETGNRRWAIVRILLPDGMLIGDAVGATVGWIEVRRDQLWAEAYHAVKCGLSQGKQVWHLDPKHWSAFEVMAEESMEVDAWQDVVDTQTRRLKAGVKFKLQDIADECGIRLNTRVDQLRLSKCVRMCGFEKQHTRSGKWWIRDF